MTPSSPFLFEKEYLRNLGRGYAGAAVSAHLSRERAIARYNENPKKCEYCGNSIPLVDGQKICQIRLKKFCNSSCSGKASNLKRWKDHKPVDCAEGTTTKRRRKKIECKGCGSQFSPWSMNSKFCSRRCAAKSIPREERVRRGKIKSELARVNRYKQLDWEESIAQEMRSDGWEIFSPTVVCDRVGVRDGKVFFIEFKPANNQKLRAGQKRIADIVPEMYIVVAK